MEHLLALLMCLANAITCVRLVLYKRAGARYRLLISVAAWVLIVSTGGTALGVALGLYPSSHIHFGDLGIALVLCALSLAARGDVAAILRISHE